MPSNRNKLTNSQVLVISLLALLLPVAWIELRVLQYTHGTIAYPLDDTFIHMVVAKNLAFQHYWGVSGHTFASSSSSPFYTLLLAGVFLLIGDHTIIPLLLNVLAGSVVLIVIHRWLKIQGLSTAAQLIILLLVNFLTPLPLLVISGMEHTFQLLFTFLFLFGAAAGIAAAYNSPPQPAPGDSRPGNLLSWTTYLWAMLMVTTRYECLPILGLVCLILLLRRRWGAAVSLGIIGVLPITIFGIYSIHKGSFFMPNSVVLKAALPHTRHGLWQFLTEEIWSRMFFSPNEYNFLTAQRLLLLLPLFYVLFIPQLRANPNRAYRIILLVLMGAVLAHVAFAFPANFPRYESYLVALSVLVMGVLIAKFWRQLPVAQIKGAQWVAAAVLLILFMPLLIRTEKTFQKSEQYCRNIYEQQYQMSQFVHNYYDSVPLAFNDIGAISYYSIGDKLDLWGLANIEVAVAKRTNRWTPAYADSLIHRHQTRLAIVYDKWFDPRLLHQWTKVACWHNQDNVVLGEDSVSFFAVRADDAPTLKKNLEAYQARLPKDVSVTYY